MAASCTGVVARLLTETIWQAVSLWPNNDGGGVVSKRTPEYAHAAASRTLAPQRRRHADACSADVRACWVSDSAVARATSTR